MCESLSNAIDLAEYERTLSSACITFETKLKKNLNENFYTTLIPSLLDLVDLANRCLIISVCPVLTAKFQRPIEQTEDSMPNNTLRK